MASLKTHRLLFAKDQSSAANTKIAPPMRINKKLDFDSCSEEDVPRSSSPDRADLRKKLLFDDSEGDFELSDVFSSPFKLDMAELMPTVTEPAKNEPLMDFRDMDTSLEATSDKFSPCRTRSGKIYTSVEKKREALEKRSKQNKEAEAGNNNNNHSASKLPMPVFIDRPRSSSRHCSGASAGIATPKSIKIQTSHLKVQEVDFNSLQKNYITDSMDVDEPTCSRPVPLVSKRPMSRLSITIDNQTPRHFNNFNADDSDLRSSPLVQQTPANLHSPPTNEVKAMKLFDKSPTYGSSPVAPFTAPKFGSRLLFGFGGNKDDHRRASAPSGLRVSFGQTEAELSGKERKRKRIANINPFTPNSMLKSMKKKYQSEPIM